MKKAIYVVVIIVSFALTCLCAFTILSSLMFPMPEQMKDKSICFLAPDLTWSDKIYDVTKSFGAPIGKASYSDITGTKTYKYETEYENHKMEVSAERQVFPHPTNVFDYCFFIQCEDEEDVQKVFDECYNQIMKDNSNEDGFSYEIVNLDEGAIIVDDNGKDTQVHEISNDEIWFSINYGATGIHYELSQTNDYKVILRAYCIA